MCAFSPADRKLNARADAKHTISFIRPDVETFILHSYSGFIFNKYHYLKYIIVKLLEKIYTRHG